MVLTTFTNGRFFVDSPQGGIFLSSLSVRDGKIVDGPLQGAHEVDLGGRLALPAFVDAHCHLLPLGESLDKVDLTGCTSLAHILQRLEAHNQTHPDAVRILAKNWIQGMTEPREIDRASLDTLDKPVYIESYDLHSSLLNSAALAELAIDADGRTPDPPGGKIVRDADGRATGWMQELAHLNVVAGFLQKQTTTEEKRRAIENAFAALLGAGYTAVGDLLMEEDAFAILTSLEQEQGRLPVRVRAYWHVEPKPDLAESLKAIDRAKELQERRKGSEYLQVVGIKLVSDGVIDSCTASLLAPYRDGSNAEPIWPLDRLTAAVQRADELGLQCAIHAIGDLSVHNAVEALASLGRERIVARRHRIEHLELSTAADVQKLGSLGITTSVQPVHADPALLDNWYNQLGGPHADRCCNRAFAYRDFLEAGAPIAIGTDAPTAPFPPLPNLHIATTRRSARDPQLDTRTTPQFALPLVAAVAAATQGAARACHVEHLQGSFAAGCSADFNVVDIDLFSPENEGKQMLLKAKVAQTFVQGKPV
ncbi:amidohydrolase 3 [Acaromyces ingoldii]|uniref:Amidohydrolase 3 n=1 Tax=Acaromyces ingoldii TaxID=215250 RepID=A0A316YEY3_9BASI|nr:amidohydrolase 3 [Acaromyces ingoldii]PWN87636.1 amidohydrolase 3 [Acaromyces ingoldii]